MSRPPFDPTTSAPDYRAPIAPEVTEPLRFPQFPSVEDILRHETVPHPLVRLSETKPPSDPPTLLEGLLGGDPRAIMRDAEDNPDRYTDRERALLDEIRAGQKAPKTLNAADATLLSQAVYNFAAFRPPKPALPKTATPPFAQKKKPALMRDEDELLDGREPQVDIPGDPMTAYWWAQ